MENKNVYIITSGCYSDYHIVGAFSTKEKAEEMLDTLDSESTIEVYALDEQVMKNEKIGLSVLQKTETCQTTNATMLKKKKNVKIFA